MIDDRTYEPHPQIYSVKTVAVPEPPKVLLSATPRARHFIPGEVRRKIGLSTFILLPIPIEVVFQVLPNP